MNSPGLSFSTMFSYITIPPFKRIHFVGDIKEKWVKNAELGTEKLSVFI